MSRAQNLDRSDIPAAAGCGQVYFQFRVWVGFDGREDTIGKLGADRYGQDADVEAVVFEDIGKEARNHAPEAVVVDGPSCVLTARATPEVFAANQNFAGYAFAGVARVVQHKIGFWRIVGVVAPVAEEVVAEPFALGCFQKAGGNNLVGVDVLDGHRNGGTAKDGEFIVSHGF